MPDGSKAHPVRTLVAHGAVRHSRLSAIGSSVSKENCLSHWKAGITKMSLRSSDSTSCFIRAPLLRRLQRRFLNRKRRWALSVGRKEMDKKVRIHNRSPTISADFGESKKNLKKGDAKTAILRTGNQQNKPVFTFWFSRIVYYIQKNRFWFRNPQ